MLKRAPGGTDFTVMPLEGLRWVADPAGFNLEDTSNWLWTAMIAQPEPVTPVLADEAVVRVSAKQTLPAGRKLRLERFEEGLAAQIMHAGPIAEERPTVERLDAFISARGYGRIGKHQEIWLNDPTRTASEKLKTIIRHPVRIVA